MSLKIQDLMQVPREQHDIVWLREALQAAVELELSTIPVYLCGMWSVKSQQGAAYETIYGIVLDEMFHMGLACNMLTTIGGTPLLNAPEVMPKYPGPLPGGVRPGLRVVLTGLTKETVKDLYMEIEFPEEGPLGLAETYTSIGAFYDAVLAAFKSLQPADFTGQRQITYGTNLFPINTFADAKRAIEKIQLEGEGTSVSPYTDARGKVLAHYYRFGGLHHGKEFAPKEGGGWGYVGPDIAFPEADDLYPMAEVPAAGYTESHDFNVKYTELLNQLHSAWATGDDSGLQSAIGTMYELGSLAVTLMNTEFPDGSGKTYGPSFQLVTGERVRPAESSLSEHAPAEAGAGEFGAAPSLFPLLESIPREFAGGTIYRAERHSFPALEGLSLNLTRLEVGAVREPHVCANAARINYVLSGSGRVGVLGTGGTPQVLDVFAGNVTFVPPGHFHWVENTGDEPLQYLTAFSHEQPATLELSEVLAATPNATLSKAFALGDDTVSRIPTRSVVIGGEGY